MHKISVIQTPSRTAGIILYADTLIQPDTIRKLADQLSQNGSDLCCLAFETENPAGYGRMEQMAHLLAIIEERDARADEKAITLVNGGVMGQRPAYYASCCHVLKRPMHKANII